MKKLKYISATIFVLFISIVQSMAQCALCSKTAQQLGDGPAQGLNKGILYLMIIPLGLLFFIGYRWYRRERLLSKEHKI